MDKKNVIVIGASSGYGKSIAGHLSSLGYNVIGASRSIRNTNVDFDTVEMDVRSNESVETATSYLNNCHEKYYCIIYSAGIAKGLNTIESGDPIWWEDVFQTNTLGLLRVIRATIRLIQQGGLFIHIGSISSKLSYIGGSDYCASKAASSSIMKTLRLELAGTGIRCVSIEPGYANTNFMLNRFDGDENRANKGITPLDVKDVADLVGFILSQNSNVNYDEIFIKPIEQIVH